MYWKLIRALRLKNITYSIWGNRKIILNYDSFHCMWIMYNYIVDWEEFNLISDYVKPSDTVADVGSNMGYYTVWMSKFVGSAGRIHAFEPDEENFERLSNNCAINKLENVISNKTALSDMDGFLSFTKSLDGENHISLSHSNETIEVKAQTFDSYCQENKITGLAYVKVDIEGFELFFLRGAGNLLKRKAIDIIQLELNNQAKNSGTEISDVLALLQQTGYSLCKYDPQRKMLHNTEYQQSRENYFAISDVERINNRLSLR